MVSGKKLVICDAETEYAARLAEYLGGKRDLSLQVKICESPEQVLSMRRDTKIDILLADENMKFTEGVLDAIPEVMYLSVFETSAPPDHKPRIYRYQSADAIYTCLVEGLTASGMGDLWAVRKKNRGQLIGYYSPIRRLGQTSQAIKHGIQLAKKSNVLYPVSYTHLDVYKRQQKDLLHYHRHGSMWQIQMVIWNLLPVQKL